MTQDADIVFDILQILYNCDFITIRDIKLSIGVNVFYNVVF